MESERILFVGFEITEELADRFADVASRDRLYLEDPTYLEVLDIDGREYVGKRTTVGIALDRLEDTARNVVSLMMRVAPEWAARPEQALVIAAESEEPSADALPSPDSFDYSKLVD